MHNMIQRYITSYYICRQAKALYKMYNGLLKPLPVPNQRWKNILVNFIINFFASKGCTNIIVVVDRLFKIRYLITYPNILTLAITQLFLD